MRRCLCAILLLATACVLRAHQYPAGDVGPLVSVLDGAFVVRFQHRDDSSDWQMNFAPDGKVVLPRHHIPRDEESSAGQDRWSAHAAGQNDSGPFRFILNERVGGISRSYPLPLEPASERVHPVDACRAGYEIGFAWSVVNAADDEREVTLNFSAASLKGFSNGITVEIGKPATIYHFPCVSNPVWAAKKWWIAWIRANPKAKDALSAWQSVLTSIDPVTGRLEHEVLPGLSTWNTGISMKTTGGWLCAAWHASMDGSYPGRAKIVTAFKKLPQ